MSDHSDKVVKAFGRHNNMTGEQALRDMVEHVERYGCRQVLVIGYDGDGDYFAVSGSDRQSMSEADAYLLLAREQHRILTGD